MKLELASLARLLIPDSMLGLQVTACFYVAPRDQTLVPILTQQMPSLSTEPFPQCWAGLAVLTARQNVKCMRAYTSMWL